MIYLLVYKQAIIELLCLAGKGNTFSTWYAVTSILTGVAYMSMARSARFRSGELIQWLALLTDPAYLITERLPFLWQFRKS